MEARISVSMEGGFGGCRIIEAEWNNTWIVKNNDHTDYEEKKVKKSK